MIWTDQFDAGYSYGFMLRGDERIGQVVGHQRSFAGINSQLWIMPTGA